MIFSRSGLQQWALCFWITLAPLKSFQALERTLNNDLCLLALSHALKRCSIKPTSKKRKMKVRQKQGIRHLSQTSAKPTQSLPTNRSSISLALPRTWPLWLLSHRSSDLKLSYSSTKRAWCQKRCRPVSLRLLALSTTTSTWWVKL